MTTVFVIILNYKTTFLILLNTPVTLTVSKILMVSSINETLRIHTETPSGTLVGFTCPGYQAKAYTGDTAI